MLHVSFFRQCLVNAPLQNSRSRPLLLHAQIFSQYQRVARLAFSKHPLQILRCQTFLPKGCEKPCRTALLPYHDSEEGERFAPCDPKQDETHEMMKNNMNLHGHRLRHRKSTKITTICHAVILLNIDLSTKWRRPASIGHETTIRICQWMWTLDSQRESID